MTITLTDTVVFPDGKTRFDPFPFACLNDSAGEPR